MSDKHILHIMTQDNQPYGSERKCCEKCGRAYWNWDEEDGYVINWDDFLPDVAGTGNLVLCNGK